VNLWLQLLVSEYWYLLLLYGLFFNDEYLFVGFFGWVSIGGMLELVGVECLYCFYC